MKKILAFLMIIFIMCSAAVTINGTCPDKYIVSTPDSVATVDEATPDSVSTLSEAIKPTSSPTIAPTEQPTDKPIEDSTYSPPVEETQNSNTEEYNQDDGKEYDVAEETEESEQIYENPSFSDSDREIIARVIMAESGNCSIDCLWLTGSALLNLADYYYEGNLEAVAYDPQVFNVADILDSVVPSQDCWDTADRLLSGDRDYKVMFFRTDYYHSFGTPYINIDNVYFSTL